MNFIPNVNLKRNLCLSFLIFSLGLINTSLFSQNAVNMYEVAVKMTEEEGLELLKKGGTVKKNDQIRNVLRQKKYKLAQFLIEEKGYTTKNLLELVNPTLFTCGVGEKTPKTKPERCKSPVLYVANADAQAALAFTKYLLAKGSVVTDLAIMNAVRANELERLELMLDNYKGEAPLNEVVYLSTATEWGFFDMVKYLVEERKVDISAHHAGRPPIIKAVKYPEIVKYYLSKGADVNSKGSNMNTTLIMNATANHGCYETAKLLLDTGKVDLTAKNNQGHDVLSFCKMSNKRDKGHMKKMEKLLKEYL